MPIRWVINPYVTVGSTRIPKSSLLVERGRTNDVPLYDNGVNIGRSKTYRCAHVTGDNTTTWALSWVVFLSAFNLDVEGAASPTTFTDVFEHDYAVGSGFLLTTPNALGWSTAQVDALRTRLDAKGADTTGLTRFNLFGAWLARLGQVLQPGWTPGNLA